MNIAAAASWTAAWTGSASGWPVRRPQSDEAKGDSTVALSWLLSDLNTTRAQSSKDSTLVGGPVGLRWTYVVRLPPLRLR